ncbi:MAG: glycosyltransferase family 4 protein [Pseudoxanthomonas sp.]
MARILFLTSRLPYPPREGHQLRSWHLLKVLASQHQVTLLSFLREEDDAGGLSMLRDTCAAVETFPIPAERSRLRLASALVRSLTTRTPFVAAKYASPALRERLSVLARDSDLVHFDILPLMAHADCVPVGVPVAFNAHNVESALALTRAGMESRFLHRRFLHSQHARLRGFEQAACRRADAVLACSDDDLVQLQRMAPDTPMRVVPNGVDLDENHPADRPPAHPDRLVFVGQMGWFPNRDGVDWFLREIFPRILAVRPQTRFELVGKSDSLEIPADVSPSVIRAGFVPDLRPHVHDAAVYIVPLRAGSGTRLKVLEAMALGKAIVTTHIGSEGIALEDGVSARYADDAEGFARAVVELLDDPQRAHELGAAARAAAESRYGWDAIGRDLLDFYAGLLSRAPQ